MNVYQVKDTKGKVYRVTDIDPLSAMQWIATRHNVHVIAWRYSRDPQDCIRVGMPMLSEE